MRRLLGASAFTSVLAAACAGTPAPRSDVAIIPPQVPAPPSPALAAVAVDAGPAPDAPREIVLPEARCVIDAAPVGDRARSSGLHRVYVGASPVASVPALGVVRSVRLVLPEASDAAWLALDTDVVSVRGSTPTAPGRRDHLELHPRGRLVRDGWLEYLVVHVEGVSGAAVTPKTELPSWITPKGLAPFRATCAELTPFGERKELAPDGVLAGTGVALEDEQGRTVATLDFPAAHKDGLPVEIVGRHKARTKIRFAVGDDLRAEGWVATRHVRASTWGGLGYGTGRGRFLQSELTCAVDTPLLVRIEGALFAWGTLRAGQRVKGHETADGAFRVDFDSGAERASREPPDARAGEATDPFVPRERMKDCTIGGPSSG